MRGHPREFSDACQDRTPRTTSDLVSTPERAVQDGKRQDDSIANFQLISSDVGDGKTLQLHVQASTREETTNIEHVTKAKEGNVSRGFPQRH